MFDHGFFVPTIGLLNYFMFPFCNAASPTEPKQATAEEYGSPLSKFIGPCHSVSGPRRDKF